MRETLQEWAGKSEILALVFTDIVDSTGLWTRLGDKQCIALIQRHMLRGRYLINLHNGREIKFIGDAFMVAFHNVVDALNFALDFRANTGDKQIKIRAGIHVGRIRIVENDLFGMMVNYTKRVESGASDSGIILSNEAKAHIDAEKDTRHSKLFIIDFSANLKGFDMPQTLWRVFTDFWESLTFQMYKNSGSPSLSINSSFHKRKDG